MTNNVVKYSESKMKCSFLTRSAKLRVNKLPLKMNEKRKKNDENDWSEHRTHTSIKIR